MRQFFELGELANHCDNLGDIGRRCGLDCERGNL
jgi:hypothetical protein